jgi:hypothetical protein
MKLKIDDFKTIRRALAGASIDHSNDAVGVYAPTLGEMYAPENHSAALHLSTPIVVGARGAGKSFWAGVLGQKDTRHAASIAYPKIGLENADVAFGFTGIGGPEGISSDKLDSFMGQDDDLGTAKNFWWSTVLRAVLFSVEKRKLGLNEIRPIAMDWEKREKILEESDKRLIGKRKTLVIVFDALDTVATDWPRRRLLTDALMEVVWGMRAFRNIRPKVFMRPDQIEDDGLRFVELPKLKTGAIRLQWIGLDLYGLLFSRLCLNQDVQERSAFERLLKQEGLALGTREDVLSRKWKLSADLESQRQVVTAMAGPYMAEGRFGYKKGRTYDWPLSHLGDAFGEVTPRSFLGLMVAAAKFESVQEDKVIIPDGLRHGLRAASKTRVDQLQLEFPWIKSILAPLSGLLLPQMDEAVFQVWKQAKTIRFLSDDSKAKGYIPPFPEVLKNKTPEGRLLDALMQIGVMFRREDGRIDMPDLFRVAAKLLKKGGTAPL